MPSGSSTRCRLILLQSKIRQDQQTLVIVTDRCLFHLLPLRHVTERVLILIGPRFWRAAGKRPVHTLAARGPLTCNPLKFIRPL